MIEETLVSTARSDPFLTLVHMREAHADLIQGRRDNGLTDALMQQAAQFVARGKNTGAILKGYLERQQAQSLVDYWYNLLRRAGHEAIDPLLVDFDPEQAPELDDALCPYRGLYAFDLNDQAMFFGRERLIQLMTERLTSGRMLAVVGPSGSGKSSVVFAGLLPRLQSDMIPGSAGWHYYPALVPGSQPLLKLARAVGGERSGESTRHAKGMGQDPGYLARWVAKQGVGAAVIVVDQFEETFTLCLDDDRRQAFMANLLGLVQAEGSQHRLIITLRTDFEPFLSRSPAFRDQYEQSLVRMLPLNNDELRAAIERPADAVGLRFEDGVVDSLIQDLLGEPAALPLLQFTLLKLWEERNANYVTWEAYSRLGGGRLALARSADEFYEDLIPELQTAVQRILLSMVQPGEGLEITSRRVKVSELPAEADYRVKDALDRLIKARLVKMTNPGTEDAQVELAHEALIRNWPRLVNWLEDERVDMRRRLRFRTAAQQWDTLDRDPSALRRGVLLAEAEQFEELNELEQAFLEASRAAVEAEEQRELAQARALAAEQQRIAELEKKRAEEQAGLLRRLRWISRLSLMQVAAFIVFLPLSTRVGSDLALILTGLLGFAWIVTAFAMGVISVSVEGGALARHLRRWRRGGEQAAEETQEKGVEDASQVTGRNISWVAAGVYCGAAALISMIPVVGPFAVAMLVGVLLGFYGNFSSKKSA